MKPLSFHLAGWTAWAPVLPSHDHWVAWLSGETERLESEPAKPSLTMVAANIRRRCPLLTRIVLQAAFNLCGETKVAPDEVDVVYCSRHGESLVLQGLLNQLHQSEPLSPTMFSNSVHHTPIGYFGITAHNRRVARAVSAGKDSLLCGFFDAAGLLINDPDRNVLLLFGDELLPDPFKRQVPGPAFPFAAAFLLNGSKGSPLQLTPRGAVSGEQEPAGDQDPALDLLRWLVSDKPDFTVNSSFGAWQWRR